MFLNIVIYLSIFFAIIKLEDLVMELVMILNIVFFAIIGLVIISAVIGLFRRSFVTLVGLGVFVILIAVFALSLGSISNFVLQYDLTTIEAIPTTYDLVINQETYTISLETLEIALQDVLHAVSEAAGASEAGSADFEEYIYALTVNIGRYFTFGLMVFVAWFISGIATFITRIVMWIVSRANPKKRHIFFASSAFSALKTTVAFFAMVMPFTAIANAVLVAYRDPQNADLSDTPPASMQEVATYVDAYDQSLLSKLMFSWTKSPTTGKTLDITLMDWIAGAEYKDEKIAFTDELIAFTGIAKTLASSGILDHEGDLSTFDWSVFAQEEAVDTIFNNLKHSHLVMSGSPLLMSIMLSSAGNTLVDESFIEPLTTDVVDADYVVEFAALQGMLNSFIRAGAFTALLDFIFAAEEDRAALESALYESLLGEDALPDVREAFAFFDTSIILSRMTPALLASMAMGENQTNINGFLEQIIPTEYEDFADYQWGHEMDVIFSSLASIYQDDETFVDFFGGAAGDESSPSWQEYLLNHKESVLDAFTGPVDTSEQLVDVDENNVYQGELPVLLDSDLIMEAVDPLIRFMFRDFNVENGIALLAFEAQMAALNDPDPAIRRANYKLGIRDMLDLLIDGVPTDYDNIEDIFPIPDTIVVDKENNTVTTTEEIVIAPENITDAGYDIPDGLETDEEGNIIIPAGSYVDEDGIHLPDGTIIPLEVPSGRYHFIPTMKFEYALF